MLEIHVGGVTFTGSPRWGGSGRGFVVGPQGFIGWRGLPSGRREALARAVEHGEHDVPVYLPSRVVTVSGWVLSDSQRDLEHRSNLVAGIGATGERLKFTVEEFGRTMWAYGRRVSGEVEDPSPGNSALHAAFELQFVFADPRKYGETQDFPRAGTALAPWVSHHGNFPAHPLIEIPSAPSSYTISAQGRSFSVSGATAGGTHTVDMRRGRVFRNGVEMFDVGVGDLWAVPPGERWQHALSVPGVVHLTDTYI